MPPQRLIRRKPLKDRILDYLNPFDRWLSVSSEIEAYDWDTLNNSIATPLGVALNVIMLIARANAATEFVWPWGGASDDILLTPGQNPSDTTRFRGLSYLMALISYGLLVFSFVNAILCISKVRPYRLFEHDINVVPATPSAHRVRVHSTPNTSTPVRMINTAFENVSNPAAMLSRSSIGPDDVMDGVTENQVWEVRVWDPTALSLRIFAMFSPAHVLVYFLALPIVPSAEDIIASINANSDPFTTSVNPYKVIVHIIFTAVVISLQTTVLTNLFIAKGADEAFMKSQVMKEYDNKFVKPRLSTKKRDAATSTDGGGSVEVSPSLGNTWQVHPSPAYAKHAIKEQHNPYFTSKRYSSTPEPSKLGPPMRQPVFNSGGGSAAAVATANGRPSMGGAMRASMLPKRVASADMQTEGPRRRSMSPVKKTPTIWAGDVDYGVPSPVRRVKKSANY